MNSRGFLECQQPMNNKNTTQAYMYRLVMLYDQHTTSTYTHEITMIVSQKFNFPIKYSVIVPNVILTIERHGNKIETSQKF